MRWDMHRVLAHKTSWWLTATELKQFNNYLSVTLLLFCINYVTAVIRSMMIKNEKVLSELR